MRSHETVSYCSGLSVETLSDTKVWGKLLPRSMMEASLQEAQGGGAAVQVHPPKRGHGGHDCAASQSHSLEKRQRSFKATKWCQGPRLGWKEPPVAGCCKHCAIPHLRLLPWSQELCSKCIQLQFPTSVHVVSGCVVSSFKTFNCLIVHVLMTCPISSTFWKEVGK